MITILLLSYLLAGIVGFTLASYRRIWKVRAKLLEYKTALEKDPSSVSEATIDAVGYFNYLF